ncbi:MAG TPA: hypothetical protein VMF52_11375 [Steroidobacteraceae bacterium]|nr:hypothetical protein [Steroidobacteraceae bacterium]
MYILVWDPAAGSPKDLDDTLQLVERLQTQPAEPHPKFLALAQRLLADSAYAGGWGAERMLDKARECAVAAWEPPLPAGDGMPAMRAVIEHADALGLIVYAAARQAVYLPGGGTVTPEQRRLEDEDFADYAARLAKRAAACRQLVDVFTRQFAPLGFAPGNIEPSAVPRSAVLSFADNHVGEFARPIDDGWQRLIVTVNDADADSEYSKCYVAAGIRHETVETIFTRVFGEYIRKPETFFFSPAGFERDRADDFNLTTAPIAGLPARVQRLAMPVLDLARDLQGLDVVMNDTTRFVFDYPLHPLTPDNLADSFVGFGRQSCLKTLIVSWLVKSRGFANRVAALRAFVKTRVDVGEADLERLLAYLRSASRP